MNEPFHRQNLNQRQQSAEETTQKSDTETSGLEFQTAEELLRHDAATIEVPETIAARLAETAPGAAPPPWWKRWLHSE